MIGLPTKEDFNTGRPSEIPTASSNTQNNQQQQQQQNTRKQSPPRQNNLFSPPVILEQKQSTSPNRHQKNVDPSVAIFSNYQSSNPFHQNDRFEDLHKNRQSYMNNNNNNNNNNSYNQISSSDQLEIKKDPTSTFSDKNQVKVLNLKGKDPSAIAKESEQMSHGLKTMNVDRDFILKGEELKAYSETSLKFGQYMVEGKLILTNYKLVFVPNNEERLSQFIDRKDQQVIPLGFIHKLERTVEKKGLQYSYIDIYCKDGRYYRFRYAPEAQNQSFEMQLKIHSFAYPEDVRKLFCYTYSIYDRQLEDQYQGWQIYDIKAEFERQGFYVQPIDYNERNQYDKDYSQTPFKFMDNSTGSICSTYPPLIVVPSRLTNDEIIRGSKFRSRERLPALSFAFKKKSDASYTTLWRCAQCKPGINSNRSPEDENMLRIIGCLEKNNNVVKTVKIYDARPYLNAVGQQITGKGYEQKQFYRNCDIEFLDIHNIHKVRESYRKMAASAYANSNDYLKEVEKSDWFIHISTILEGTRRVIETLKSGTNVVIHCSDGWDRTAQLIALAQICIDPYFRTIQGFEVLIEKDWVQFGHQFSLRTGHGAKNFNDDQRAPIFIQFLDCVYQLMEQYPLSFEFNSKFLADIAYHYLSCRFGTFLYNHYQDQVSNNARQQTVSLWSYLNSQVTVYENPFYLSVNDIEFVSLQPDGHVRRFSVWKDHFMIYQQGYCDVYKIYNECNFPEDNKYVLKRSSQMRYEQFREENKLLHKKIEELEAQLKALNLNNNVGNGSHLEQLEKQKSGSRRNTESKLSQNPLMQANFGASKKSQDGNAYQINIHDETEKDQHHHEIQKDQLNDLLSAERPEEFVSNQELDKAYIQDGGEEKAEDFGSLNQDEIEHHSNLQSNQVVDTEKNLDFQEQQEDDLLQDILKNNEYETIEKTENDQEEQHEDASLL